MTTLVNPYLAFGLALVFAALAYVAQRKAKWLQGELFQEEGPRAAIERRAADETGKYFVDRGGVQMHATSQAEEEAQKKWLRRWEITRNCALLTAAGLWGLTVNLFAPLKMPPLDAVFGCVTAVALLICFDSFMTPMKTKK
jgi:hypothetical protein